MKYTIEMYLSAQYEIEAESEEEALAIADGYWYEAIPETTVLEVED